MNSNLLVLVGLCIVGIVAIAAVIFPESKFGNLFNWRSDVAQKKSTNLLFFIAAIGLGSILILKGGRAIYHGYETTGWLATQGAVISSETVISGYTRERSRCSVPLYAPKITYSYAIQDVKYTSSRFRYGSLPSMAPAKADAVVRQYPVGRQVTAFFNPSSPEQAVLIKGIALGALGAFGSGLLLFVVAALLLRSVWRSRADL